MCRVAVLAVLLVAPRAAAQPPKSLEEKARAALATLEGEIRLPALRERVEVLRDRWGVPHIYAKNSDDLFFAQGFVAAQDRLFQLEMWRRAARGETAEIIGPSAIEADRFARLIRYRGDMYAEWHSYAHDTQRIVTAFVNGINACIDQLGDRVPVEFQALGIKPGKWRPEDCLGRLSSIAVTGNFQREIVRAWLVASVGVEKARLLAPTDPAVKFAPGEGLDLSGIDGSALAGYRAAVVPPRFAPLTESNNWAVSGKLSASGKPLLASDPHRALTLPALRYLVHLNAPGWNVIGSGEPALPGVAIGHNDKIAWGFTVVGTDQADVYVEVTHLDDPNRYKADGEWLTMDVIRETIRVKGEAKPREVTLRWTRHGPVIHQDVKRRRALALKWVGSEPGTAAYLGALSVNRARNADEFYEALKSWRVPSENFVYADVEGNIGWLAAALTPVREGHNGLLPVPGASGKYRWTGYLPIEELPQSFNPESGVVATANHNILPKGYDNAIGYEFAPPYRIERVLTRLAKKKPLTLDDFKSIQHDEVSLPGLALAKLAKQVDMGDPQLEISAKLLAGWDGSLGKDSAAGALYAVWLQELQEAFYRAHVPAELVEPVRTISPLPVMLAALEKADPAWFGQSARAERDRLVRETFTRAVRRLDVLLPGGPKRWSWGELHTASFRHPLSEIDKGFRAFDLKPVQRGGDGHTPNNTRHGADFRQSHGASYRHLFDLADWDRGVATSAPGQSGQPGSPHYADLLPLWAAGEYFPLAFSRARVEAVTRHRLVLVPAR